MSPAPKMISARCLQREMAGNFPRSLPTTPHFEICQMKQGFFSLISTTDKTPKMPNTNAKKSALTYYYNRQGAKWPGAGPDNKKAVNLFQDLLLSMTADGWPVFTFDRLFKGSYTAEDRGSPVHQGLSSCKHGSPCVHKIP